MEVKVANKAKGRRETGGKRPRKIAKSSVGSLHEADAQRKVVNEERRKKLQQIDKSL